MRRGNPDPDADVHFVYPRNTCIYTASTKLEGFIMSNMGTWKTKQYDKRRKGSNTPGRTKGGNCVASTMDRFFAKRGRSYKHPDYGEWCRKCDEVNNIVRN